MCYCSVYWLASGQIYHLQVGESHLNPSGFSGTSVVKLFKSAYPGSNKNDQHRESVNFVRVLFLNSLDYEIIFPNILEQIFQLQILSATGAVDVSFSLHALIYDEKD